MAKLSTEDILTQKHLDLYIYGLAAVKMNALVVNFGNVYLLASPHKSVFTDILNKSR